MKPRFVQWWLVGWRDTRLLLREFQGPLLIFTLAIAGCAAAYFWLAKSFGEGLETYPEALYLMLTLTFLQPSGDFPNHPALQGFYFLMPVIGLLTLAQGLADFSFLLFNRRARSKEWEMALASTLKNHHVVVGLGHLGYRAACQLLEMGESVTVIEMNPQADTLAAIQNLNIPVIHEDATRPSALEAANLSKAASIVLCTQNDAVNLKIALAARRINPLVRVTIRIFDEEFAQALHEQFGFTALSGTGLAAPAFAAAAAGVEISAPISIEGEALSLARLVISPHSILAGKTVGFVEDNYSVSILLIRANSHSMLHPTDSLPLPAGTQMAALGKPQKLHALLHVCQDIETAR